MRIPSLLKAAREKHMPRKRVKYQRKLHKKMKWITNGILMSINQKEKLYKNQTTCIFHSSLIFVQWFCMSDKKTNLRTIVQA